TAATAGAVIWLWRSDAAFPRKAAGLALAALLATPYSLDYDMMVLAPAIAFLAAHGRDHGFSAYEKTVLAALWLAPLLARPCAEAEAILKTGRQEVWREKTGAPRTAFASHTYSEVFRLLAHHPRLVDPLQQLFGEGVYVHQFKINAKAAFEGDVWQWHQDYGTWARDDGMPEPRAMNISVFLDEVMPINGPLMIIPKS